MLCTWKNCRDFQGNKLTGQIPDEIGNCGSLVHLYYFCLSFFHCFLSLFRDMTTQNFESIVLLIDLKINKFTLNVGSCLIICCMGTSLFRYLSLSSLSFCKFLLIHCLSARYISQRHVFVVRTKPIPCV